jgi:hypothetical protein
MRGGSVQRGMAFLSAFAFLESRQSGTPPACCTASVARGRASSSPLPSVEHWTLIISAPLEARSFAMASMAFRSFFFTASMYAAFLTFRFSAMTSIVTSSVSIR